MKHLSALLPLALLLVACSESDRYPVLHIVKMEQVTNTLPHAPGSNWQTHTMEVWGTVYSFGYLAPTGYVTLSQLGVVHGSNLVPLRTITVTNNVFVTNQGVPTISTTNFVPGGFTNH